MLALYVLTLGVSSFLFGAFAHNLLALVGFAPTFRGGVMLAGGLGCAHACLQLLCVVLVQALKPTRTRSYLLAESMSHLAALVFIPYLLHIQVPWPDPMLQRVEPLVYLGAFAAVFAALKLVSFYAALWAEASPRWAVSLWLGAATLMALVAGASLLEWHDDLEAQRSEAPEVISPYRIGGTYAMGRTVPEGAMIEYALEDLPERCLDLHWANAPDSSEGFLERVYVTVRVGGGDSDTKTAGTARLDSSGWTRFRVPADKVPADARTCTVTWTHKRPPSWLRLTGLRPVVRSNKKILLAGPHVHLARSEDEPPNIVIIAVDGLRSDHVSAWGYERKTTPFLDRMAHSALTFQNVYPPAPEPGAAYMTLLTGVGPLHHGILGEHEGPVPRACRTLPELVREGHYATAAFTEGEALGDLIFGSGFERGFELFDASFTPPAAEQEKEEAEDAEAKPELPPPSGSAATVRKAQAWIEQNRDTRFMLFVRLSELGSPALLPHYPDTFTKDRKKPTTEDIYDTALAYVDRQVGGLVAHVRDYETRSNTCVIVTSSHGLDLLGSKAVPALSEAALRVPLFVYKRGLVKEYRGDYLGLDNIAPALARLTQTSFGLGVTARDFLAGPVMREPITLSGDPLALSVRSEKWRFMWQTNCQPFQESIALSLDGKAKLHAIRDSVASTRSAASQNAELVEEWKARLKSKLLLHGDAWREAMAN